MDTDARGRTELIVKAEDDLGDMRMDDKPTYRSWKKKYRKMRIVFDQKMHEGEELHQLEAKALATARRLAIQKDRLLDLLLDVNNSAQIPPDKRFDLSIELPSDPEALYLDIDRPSTPPPGAPPAKSFKKLLRDVPHLTFASATENFPELLADLEAVRDAPADPAQGQPHPPSFLTADDIDNYIWEIDNRLANKEFHDTGVMPPLLPTLAPQAHPDAATNGAGPASSNRDFALRNPTSVYNWLRKHAPKTFLQDGEAHSSGDKENGDEPHPPSARGHGRSKGERGGRAAGSGRGKRGSAAHRPDRAEVSEHDETGYDASGLGIGKGKRKRHVDEDAGYRPKGGASRPTKKKRKSESGIDTTPTAGPKRPRKSGVAGGSSTSKGGDD